MGPGAQVMDLAVQPMLAADAEPEDAELTARLLSAISDEYARLVVDWISGGYRTYSK